jgi:hypothetical protein
MSAVAGVASTVARVNPRPVQAAKPKIAHRTRRAGRPRQLPTVGTRVCGMRGDFYSPWQAIYCGCSSDFGQLGDAIWYRMRETTRVTRADCWRISAGICGERVYLAAVVDDFGDLIAVSGA